MKQARIFVARIMACGLALAAAFCISAQAATTKLAIVRPLTTLTATNTNGLVSGTLFSGSLPLANATLKLAAFDVAARTGLSWRQIYGTVPLRTASAVIGIRAGTEDSCICAGAAGAAVGGIYYVESGTGYWQGVSPVSVPIAGAPYSVRTLPLLPDQSISIDLMRFPVTPGAAYALTLPLSATGNAVGAGYVTVMFFDSQGTELGRNNMWFQPSQQDLGSVTTDSRGQFQVTLPPAVAAILPEINVTYAGSLSTPAGATIIASAASGDQAAMPALAQQVPAISQLAAGTPELVAQKQVWFTPREDFLGLLVQGQTWAQVQQQWSSAAAHVQIVKLSSAALLAIPDSELPRILRDLDSQHLALALEIEPTNWYHEAYCGGGVESYSDPGTANLVVYKLLKSGGKLSAITLDEPLWYGHYYAGLNACKSSIQDEARRAAVIVKIFTAAFPNLVVGDTEPFPEMSVQPNWQADFAAWVQAFRDATGTPLSFLHLDFDWDMGSLMSWIYPNPAAISDLAQRVAPVARANGLQVGMIVNGNQSATLDAVWVWQAQVHIDAIEASGIKPEQLLFETWSIAPARTLPETDPATLTSLINYYFLRYP